MDADEVIRLAKELAFFLQTLAKHFGVELDGVTLTGSSDDDGNVLVKLNAGDLHRRAAALKYGSIDPETC